MPVIEFKSLDIIQGFKSFDKAQSFFIDDLDPGFYFITGENRVEPKLGANGAGKSSIWDSLCWVLFEKVPTNLKAGNISCWNSNIKTMVSLRMEVDSTPYLLTRTWNPNKLCLSEDGGKAKIITNEDVTSLIGFNFEAFLYSILISQFSSKFFDLIPSEKMSVFSSVMESSLACWLDYSNKAKDKKLELESTIKETESSISHIAGQIVSLKEEDYSDKIKEWEKSREEELEEIEQGIKEKSKEIKKLESKVKDSDKKIGKLDDKIDSLKEKQSEITESLADLREEEKDARQIKAEIVSEIKSLKNTLNSLQGLKGVCPTCLQKVDSKHLKKEVQKFKKDLIELEDQLEEAEDLLIDLSDKLDKASQKEYKFRDEIRSLNTVLMKEQLQAEQIEKRVEVLEKAIDSEQEEYDVLIDKDNPYSKLEEEKKVKIKRLKDNKKKKDSSLVSYEEDHGIYGYWVNGFKDIRFMILSEALHELEIQINNSLEKLGLVDWEILLSVDKTSKKGNVTKGFTVFIKSPNNENLVPFESWSGGERQRLRLAGTLGMMDFIADRMGFKTNIEIYDEPTQWLSEKGIDDLLEILYDRARDTGKKLFMIDHRDFHTFGGFDGFIKVVKDEEGSRIEIE